MQQIWLLKIRLVRKIRLGLNLIQLSEFQLSKPQLKLTETQCATLGTLLGLYIRIWSPNLSHLRLNVLSLAWAFIKFFQLFPKYIFPASDEHVAVGFFASTWQALLVHPRVVVTCCYPLSSMNLLKKNRKTVLCEVTHIA